MRLKHIIQEENSPRSEQATLEQAAELIAKNCSAAANRLITEQKCIYRGVDAKSTTIAFIGDTSKAGPRKSANTHNYYTITIDNSPHWAQYPKRGYSFICSTSSSYASSYGVVFGVFPTNGTKIGVCSDMDMWDSFSELGDFGPSDLNDEFDFFFKMCKAIETKTPYYDIAVKSGWRPPDNNINEFKKALNHCEALLSEYNIKNNIELYKAAKETGSTYHSWWTDRKWMYDIVRAGQRHNGIFNWYQKLIAPDINGFKLTTIEQFTFPSAREVWFSGQAIFVEQSQLKKLIDLLAK